MQVCSTNVMESNHSLPTKSSGFLVIHKEVADKLLRSASALEVTTEEVDYFRSYRYNTCLKHMYEDEENYYRNFKGERPSLGIASTDHTGSDISVGYIKRQINPWILFYVTVIACRHICRNAEIDNLRRN